MVLIDFWTYSCINWRREFPYVRAWAEKYRSHGLVVIGVHSPEFEFEKKIENVRQAIQQIGVRYPVAFDSNHTIWNSFGNAYWPALYFIDAQGRVRHNQYGEGEYDTSERVIQRLLMEAGASGVATDPISIQASGPEAPAALADLRSGENYLGYARTQDFASPGGVAADKAKVYAMPEQLRRNQWALLGDWLIRSQAILSQRENGRIAYMFHARDLHLVMGPPVGGRPVRFRVLIDGALPGGAAGSDVDAQGLGTVMEPRMYQLIRQRQPVTDRRFEIEFLDSGAEVYAFTFG
ncbi:MAG: redoxin domain-containing protein [Pyrinomonadaceae bacterium]|nr:redoxin domain-containing protein [Phycisphaerales bacterium]